jgi:transposase
MKKKTYTDKFKRQAVELASELGNTSEAAAQLGIRDSSIHTWKQKLKLKNNKSIKLSDAEIEIKELRKEIGELKKVNHILKSAAAFFCQDQIK